MLIRYAIPHELGVRILPEKGSDSRSISGSAYSTSIHYIRGRLEECRVQFTDTEETATWTGYRCLEDYKAEVNFAGHSSFIEAKRGDVLLRNSALPILSFQIV